MGFNSKVTGWALAATISLSLPVLGRADTQAAHPDTQTPATPQAPHRVHSKKKNTPPPPLPSGTQGPVPQVPLDAIPAVAPQVSYENGLLTIVAPNSTLGDILRGVRKHTSAEIEIPSTANERVVTHLGPAPAREVMAELLNGSRFNYILLGAPDNANTLVRVVLVAKTPDTPAPQPGVASAAAAVPDPNAEVPDETVDDTADQSAAEAEQSAPPADQPGVKTPQQLLQEMQQRQLQMQQQQQASQPGGTPPPMPPPHQPQNQAPQDQQ